MDPDRQYYGPGALSPVARWLGYGDGQNRGEGPFPDDDASPSAGRGKRSNYHGGHTLAGMTGVEEGEVIKQQENMSRMMKDILGADVAPELNPDGKPGPATNGVEAALHEFFNAMLEGLDVPPNASLDEKEKALREKQKALSAEGAHPEKMKQFSEKLGAETDAFSGKIKALSDSNLPNGFSNPMSGEAAPAPEDGGKNGPAKPAIEPAAAQPADEPRRHLSPSNSTAEPLPAEVSPVENNSLRGRKLGPSS